MSEGLLTGAEPTQAAYDDCLIANLDHADAVIEQRALAKHGWMTRQFFRSTDGREWRLVTEW